MGITFLYLNTFDNTKYCLCQGKIHMGEKNIDYWMSKKSGPVLYGKLLYKLGQDFLDRQYTVCPGSSDPFYIASLLYKLGQDFLDRQYM